jgi:hypothetical protein
VRRLSIAAGLCALALVAGCAAVAWPHDSLLVSRNGGHPHGVELWSWLYFGFVLGAFVAYLLGIGLLRRYGGRLALVVVVAAAIQLAPLAAPLMLSSDAWTYWDYARIAAVHGGNPYVQHPADYPQDPAFAHAGSGWRKTSSVYGPAFTLASEPLALADGASANATAWTYKALAAAAMLAITLLVARLTRSAFAVAFVGWNPLLAIHFAGGGHNDAWMAALVVAALALAASGRRQLAGAAWALAILIKWVPLLFLVLRAVEARGRRRVAHLGFAATAVAVLALASWRYGWHWLGAVGPLARNANKETYFAIPHRLGALAPGSQHAWAFALAAAFGLAYLWLLREAWRGRARLGLCAGLLLVATPWLVPWYAVWAVPLAAVDDDPPAQLLALGLSAYLLRQAVPL